MTIILHTSKTMRPYSEQPVPTRKPIFNAYAKELNVCLQTLDLEAIKKFMSISDKLALSTMKQIKDWKAESKFQRFAIDSFLGDIYSGLQVPTWTKKDYTYADEHLRILSGLYGILKPLDTISPYRLEMGYRLPDKPYASLYEYWGTKIADQLKDESIIINLSAVEYSKTFTSYIDASKVITPSFLTVSPKTGEPKFVVVHAKIARGAFAGWLIKNRIKNDEKLKDFNELNYKYSKELSKPSEPVFVCENFGGLGLSVRLT